MDRRTRRHLDGSGERTQSAAVIMGVIGFGLGMYALGRSGGPSAAACTDQLTHCKLDLIAARSGSSWTDPLADSRAILVTQA